MISIIILLVVFALIAVRQIGNLRLQIWQIMLFGAFAVLITGQISPVEAFMSINPDVMLFLFSMFVVGQALEESGFLASLSYRFFKRARSVDHLVLFILFGMGIASAFLMNDTLAIIGTPVVLGLAKKNKIFPRLLLLSLAFAVTTGSVMSPIGNPQNLLIVINGNISDPFITFFKYLFLPTIINLFIVYLFLKLFYKEYFHDNILDHTREPIKDQKLATISKISLILIIILIGIKIISVFWDMQIDLRISYIGLISAVPVILFGTGRFNLIKRIDWHTLIFFAAMFILMQSVWASGFFQKIITGLDINITSIALILLISVIMSQFISNVPLAALYLPVLVHSGASTEEMIALAAGSTIAGNLFILGAASNVIIIQNAEKKYGETLTFLEFARIGIPLTVLNVLIFWLFLR